LSQLERHVLGWDRGDDLVSELIPSIYLNFVRYGHADPLVPVFQHNQMDLRGLAGLSARILSLLGEEAVSQDGLELYGVSRMCERRGEVKRARKLYEQSIASTLPSETDRAARTALARLAKRDGDLALARELWESTLGNSREGYVAYEQLAIHFEHRARDPRQALGIVREALAQLRRANQVGMIAPSAYRRTKAQFEHRLGRLERKAGQTLLEAFDA
jgi:tetratricopeptide (TPR) repeat protein